MSKIKEDILEMVKNNPNDSELGKIVRNYSNQLIKKEEKRKIHSTVGSAGSERIFQSPRRSIFIHGASRFF